MQANVIILTSGLTGSSVLTGLVAQAGYWTGETHKKEDYDTYENRTLIALNKRLLEQAGYRGNYLEEFSPAVLERISSLENDIDPKPYQEFIAACNQNQPWIWKDPRLWLTIRYWRHLLNPEQCRFIVLTRDYFQCWTSSLLRRQIRSYRNAKSYEQNVHDSIVSFLRANGLSSLSIQYDTLISDPAATIARLNSYLETRLTVDDLARVYRDPLYTRPSRPLPEVVKALLIYAKNYGQRIDASPAGRQQ